MPLNLPTHIDHNLIKNKTRRVSRKQYRWLQWYIKTGDATLSAVKAYRVSNVSGAVIGHENLSKLNYAEYLELAGITDAMLTSKLGEGLNANRTIVTDKTGQELIEKPDLAVRHKYLETAYKLKKRLIPSIQRN